jgi:hypothetical protein
MVNALVAPRRGSEPSQDLAVDLHEFGKADLGPYESPRAVDRIVTGSGSPVRVVALLDRG